MTSILRMLPGRGLQKPTVSMALRMHYSVAETGQSEIIADHEDDATTRVR